MKVNTLGIGPIHAFDNYIKADHNQTFQKILTYIPDLSSVSQVSKKWKFFTLKQLLIRFPEEKKKSVKFIKALAECHYFNACGMVSGYSKNKDSLFDFAMRHCNIILIFETFKDFGFNNKSKDLKKIEQKTKKLYDSFTKDLDINLNQMAFYLSTYRIKVLDSFIQHIFWPFFKIACKRKQYVVALSLLELLKILDKVTPWQILIQENEFSKILKLIFEISDNDLMNKVLEAFIFAYKNLNHFDLSKLFQLFQIAEHLKRLEKDEEALCLEERFFEAILDSIESKSTNLKPLLCSKFHQVFNRLIEAHRYEDAKRVASLMKDNSEIYLDYKMKIIDHMIQSLIEVKQWDEAREIAFSLYPINEKKMVEHLLLINEASPIDISKPKFLEEVSEQDIDEGTESDSSETTSETSTTSEYESESDSEIEDFSKRIEEGAEKEWDHKPATKSFLKELRNKVQVCLSGGDWKSARLIVYMAKEGKATIFL